MNSESDFESQRAEQNFLYTNLQAPSIDQIDYYQQDDGILDPQHIDIMPLESEESRQHENLHSQIPEEEFKDYNLQQKQQELYGDPDLDYSNPHFNLQTNQQYQTQNIHQQYLQRANILDHSRQDPSDFNIFSNSFDEFGSSFDYRPQRTCKSSTRMASSLNKNLVPQSQPHQKIQTQNSGLLTASSMNRRQGAFSTYMKTQQNTQVQNQNNYQQKILNQLQRNTSLNASDTLKSGVNAIQDYTNRSAILNQGMVNSSFVMNQYLQQTNISNLKQPISPNTLGSNTFQGMFQTQNGPNNQRNNQAMGTPVDPYAYLRWQQQKYKSCRSMIYNKKQQNSNSTAQRPNNFSGTANMDSRSKRAGKLCASSCSSHGSSHFNTSSTTIPGAVKSLKEVKNPQFFIQFRFNDRKVTELNEISLFKNLTSLDVSGNLLKEEVVELKQLTFLKKLNLSNNQICEMYQLPTMLEFLNLSYNQLKGLNGDVCAQLKSLSTIDLSNNGIESLDGIQQLKRLKRLIAKNNQIQELDPLQEIQTLIEIDLENNPVDSYGNLVQILSNKKDILYFNLKSSPLMITVQNYEQFIKELNLNTQEEYKSEIQSFEKRLKYFYIGSLYRSRRVFKKLRNVQEISKRSNSNQSNGSLSCGRVATHTPQSPLLGNLSATPNHTTNPTQRQEDIEAIYNEILDEEDQHQRKLNKKMKSQSQLAKGEGMTPTDQEEEDLDDDESFMDEDDFIHQTYSGDEDELGGHSYRENNHLDFNHHEKLNESTADFNKEIRQINQELRMEENGHFAKNSIQEEPQSLQSTQSLNMGSKKNQISFKLDLSKCKNDQEIDNYELLEVPNNAAGDINLEDDNFEIPGLNFVKVTDDSFRQREYVEQSKREFQNQNQMKLQEQQNTSKKDSSNQIQHVQNKPSIPKLQLSNLIKGGQNPSVPQGSIMKIPSSSKKPQNAQEHNEQSMRKMKQGGQVQQKSVRIEENPPSHSLRKQQEEQKQLAKQGGKSDLQVIQEVQISKSPTVKSSSPEPSKTKSPESQKQQSEIKSQRNLNTKYLQLQDELLELRQRFEFESEQNSTQIKNLTQVLNEIKDTINFTGKNEDLPQFIKVSLNEFYNLKQEQLQQIESLTSKNQELSLANQKFMKELENEKSNMFDVKNNMEKQLNNHINSIENLQKQLDTFKNQNNDLVKQIEDQKQINQSIIQKQSQISPDPKLPIKDNNLDSATILNNEIKKPDFFYQKVKTEEEEDSSEVAQIINQRNKKKVQCVNPNVTKIKRPQSVANVKRKPKWFPKLNLNSQQSNFEYGSIQGDSSQKDNSMLSQTMNKKVGVYIEKLRERNSSLQERLNMSLQQVGNSNTATKLIPKKQNSLNKTQYQDQIHIGSIISPMNNAMNLDKSQLANYNTAKNINIVPTSSKDQFQTLSQAIGNLKLNKSKLEDAYQVDQKQAKTQRFLAQKVKFNQIFQKKRESLATHKNEEYSFNMRTLPQYEHNYNTASNQSESSFNQQAVVGSDRIRQLSFRKGSNGGISHNNSRPNIVNLKQ